MYTEKQNNESVVSYISLNILLQNQSRRLCWANSDVEIMTVISIIPNINDIDRESVQ